jgi:hypothetical protein
VTPPFDDRSFVSGHTIIIVAASSTARRDTSVLGEEYGVIPIAKAEEIPHSLPTKKLDS